MQARPFQTRPFEERDLAGILRIERRSFDRDAWLREVFEEYASAGRDLFLVARVAGTIAGYSIACVARQGAEIASLAVDPRYRQRGIATALLKTTIRKLRRADTPEVWLMVRRQNEQAIQLYRKLGFVRMRTIPNYYDDESTGWRMRLLLQDREEHS